MDFYDLIYNNIFTLSKGDMLDIPNNKEEIQKEIISIIKKIISLLVSLRWYSILLLKN